MNIVFRLKLLGLLTGLAIVLSACQGAQVGYNLDQAGANRIVSVLNANGISAMARQETGSRGKLGVFVERSAYTQAVTILDSKGLPGEAQLSFAETVANQGLLPGSREMEQLRLDHALALEVESLLENHPQVISAKAIVRQNFLKEAEQPAVSVILETEKKSPNLNEEVVSIIQRAVPGITSDRITVSSHDSPADLPLTDQLGVLNLDGRPVLLSLASFLGYWRVPKDDYVSLAFALAGLLVLCLSVGSVIGYWYGYYVQSRRFFEQSPSDLVPKVTRMDVRRVERDRLQQIDLTGSEWTRND